jgi:hypothetical protein
MKSEAARRFVTSDPHRNDVYGSYVMTANGLSEPGCRMKYMHYS